MPLKRHIGAILWILCFQFLLAEQLASRAWRLPYSFTRNYISDLGAVGCDTLICSPLHSVMNGSFVLQGFLIAVGSLLLWQDSQNLERFALVLLVICGAGVLIVGFAPEDANPQLHFMGAAAHFVAGGVGICLMGLAALRKSISSFKGWSFAVVGLSVLIATLLLGERHSWDMWIFSYPGAIERVASYGITIWLVSSGGFTWRTLDNRP